MVNLTNWINYQLVDRFIKSWSRGSWLSIIQTLLMNLHLSPSFLFLFRLFSYSFLLFSSNLLPLLLLLPLHFSFGFPLLFSSLSSIHFSPLTSFLRFSFVSLLLFSSPPSHLLHLSFLSLSIYLSSIYLSLPHSSLHFTHFTTITSANISNNQPANQSINQCTCQSINQFSSCQFGMAKKTCGCDCD